MIIFQDDFIKLVPEPLEVLCEEVHVAALAVEDDGVHAEPRHLLRLGPGEVFDPHQARTPPRCGRGSPVVL